METTAELEINIFSAAELSGVNVGASAATATKDERLYYVELRFTDPRDDYRLAPRRKTIAIDYKEFQELDNQPLKADQKAIQYGQRLTEILFGPQELKEYFQEKRKSLADSDAESGKTTSLRIVINLDSQAPELHSLRWETLRDPLESGAGSQPGSAPKALLNRQNIWFSRFLMSKFSEATTPRQKQQLSAMVAIANPDDLKDDLYTSGPQPHGTALTEIAVEGELQRACQALKKLDTTILERTQTLARGHAQTQVVSLESLSQVLKQGWDIFYLVCHGILDDQHTGHFKPYLLLEKNEDPAQGDIVLADRLVDQLRDIPPNKRPRLIVLASCQSAGTGLVQTPAPAGQPAIEEPVTADANSVMQAIGPKLAALGIPAVIAMQGNISMLTVEKFIPAFFEELAKDGQIDRALAMARGAVKDRPDDWMPVLYLGYKEGRLWYQPRVVTGLQEDTSDETEQQNRLLQIWNNVKDLYPNELIPIIGPGLSEAILGSRRQFSSELANKIKYPLDEYDFEEVERIALFLATDVNPDTARSTYRAELLEHLRRRYQASLGQASQGFELPELLKAISEQFWQNNPNDPLFLLADLQFPVYITTAQDTLLALALQARGKKPRQYTCNWWNNRKNTELEGAELNDPGQPVIYYLFGKLDQPKSLVLTLDDVLDYLINVPRSKLIPDNLWFTLTERSTIFLGANVNDWSFRVFMRMVLSMENASLYQKLSHLAVQVNPQGERLRSLSGARRFLERYFTHATPNFSVLWLRADDFVADLHSLLKK